MNFRKIILNISIAHSFSEMDDILYDDFHCGKAMDNFVTKKMNKLQRITLMEIINDTIFRSLFIKFLYGLREDDTESIIPLKRFILCQKLVANPDLFDDNDIYNKIIELSPSFLWEMKIKKLAIDNKKDLSFIFAIETLKWESLIEIIIHNDYKIFLMEIKRKSEKLINILKKIYRNYYF